MTQVTMPAPLGGSGYTYSDDGTSAHDMTNGGHRVNLLPMLVDTVAMANSALASAQSAVNAPGTNGTSTTSMTIATGAQSFTTQTGKAFVVGQSVKIANTASPTNWMLGDITAYTSGSGAMTVNVTAINGSGAGITTWTIGLSAPTVSLNYVPYVAKTGAYTVLKADMAALFDCSNTSWTLAYTAAATLGANWWGWVYNSGAGVITLDPSGAETINGALTQPVLPGEMWLVLCTGAAFKAFCLDRASLGGSATAPTPTFPYMLWADTTAAPALLKMRNGANNAWITLGDVTQTNLGLLSLTGAQTQSATAFTTAGSAPNFTQTPPPAIAAYVAGQRFRVKFNASGTTGSNTLNITSLGALNLKQYDATGAKVSGVVASGALHDVEYDGTDAVILNPLTPVAAVSPPVRQTVLSGPVDSSGYSAFGGSTGSATITATGTLKATASAGGDANYSGSITNPAWTSPGGSGTGYLMLGITSAGVVSTSVRTLPPVYQWGGTYSVANGQLTYNIQEATMKAGNGSTASQVYEVCVGECPYTSGSWSGSITWYQLMGRTQIHVASPTFAAATSNSVSHKLGTLIPRADVYYECKNAEFGYAAGDLVGEMGAAGYGANGLDGGHYCNKTSVVHRQGGAAYVLNLAGGINAIGNTNWGLFFDIRRGW